MKKNIRVSIVFIIIFGLFLTGCGSSKMPKEKEIYILENQSINGEVVIEHDNNIVKKTVSKTFVNYVKAGVDKNTLKKDMKESSKKYDGIRGIKDKIKVEGNEVVETLEINFEKLSISDKAMLFGEAVDKNNNISADKLGEKFISLGYVKK